MGAAPRVGSAVALPRRSPWLFGLFRRYVRGYLARNFHAVRLAKGGFVPDATTPGPIVVVMNHPSWWDPLVGLPLTGLFGDRAHFAPIDAAGLTKYPFLERLGFFGIEPGSPRGGLAFLRQSLAILSRPDAMLWVTAQGRFVDPRDRSVPLKDGVGRLAKRMKTGVIVPLAIEYPFWSERTPEALARFGPPIALDAPGTAAEWSARVDEALRSAQDALGADAVARDPSRFFEIISGRTGVGGVYDGFRRLKAAARGERFAPGHADDVRRIPPKDRNFDRPSKPC